MPPGSDHADPADGDLILHLDGPGYSARGREGEESFFVLEGSHARKAAVRSIPDRVTKKRRELLDHGVLVEDKAGYRFVKNCSFGSPSAAACVVVGGSEDGLRAWKDDSGRPLKEIRRR